MSQIDLPPNVTSHLLKTGSEAYQALMTDLGNNGAHAHNMTRLVGLRKHDELGSIESRAHSGVMATPIASPATQQSE